MKKTMAEKIKDFVNSKLSEKNNVILGLQNELKEAKKAHANQFVMNLPEKLKLETPEIQKVYVNSPVEVKNLNDIKFPTEIKVLNLKDLKFPAEIKISNLPKDKEVQKVEVVNKDDGSTPPAWLEGIMGAFLSALSGMLVKVVSSIGKITFKIALPDDFYSRPIPMIQIDRNTNKALDRRNYLISGGGSAVVNVQKQLPPTAIKSGKAIVTASGTAQPLAAEYTAISKITVTALYANQGNIYIGDDITLASEFIGVPLTPGQAIDIQINDLSKIYIDAEQSNDGVSFITLN